MTAASWRGETECGGAADGERGQQQRAESQLPSDSLPPQHHDCHGAFLACAHALWLGAILRISTSRQGQCCIIHHSWCIFWWKWDPEIGQPGGGAGAGAGAHAAAHAAARATQRALWRFLQGTGRNRHKAVERCCYHFTEGTGRRDSPGRTCPILIQTR